jgi:transcriptional regulator with PAS, ATPase and Fis domain
MKCSVSRPRLDGQSWEALGRSQADIRVIVATNRHLPDAVAQGRFRADLYYHVNVFDIRIPPMRERRDDITVLAESFLRELSHGMGRPVSPSEDEGKNDVNF